MKGRFEATVLILIAAVVAVNFAFLTYIYPSLTRSESNLISAYNKVQSKIKDDLVLVGDLEDIFTKIIQVHNKIKVAREELANILSRKEKFDIADFTQKLQESGARIESFAQTGFKNDKDKVIYTFTAVLNDTLENTLKFIGYAEDYSPNVEVESYSVNRLKEGNTENITIKVVLPK